MKHLLEQHPRSMRSIVRLASLRSIYFCVVAVVAVVVVVFVCVDYDFDYMFAFDFDFDFLSFLQLSYTINWFIGYRLRCP